MAIRALNNSTYSALNWNDEIVSKDALKRGFSKIEWFISGSNIVVKAGSYIDVDGVIYLIESDETITGPITDNLITFNGTTFNTTTGELEYNEEKKGYYVGATDTRVVGYYYDGAVKSVIYDTGVQETVTVNNLEGAEKQIAINSNTYISGESNARVTPGKMLTIPSGHTITDVCGVSVGDEFNPYIYAITNLAETYRTIDDGFSWANVAYSGGTAWGGISINDKMTLRSFGIVWNGTPNPSFSSDSGATWSNPAGVTYGDNINSVFVGGYCSIWVGDNGYVWQLDSGAQVTTFGTEDLYCVESNSVYTTAEKWIIGGNNGTLAYVHGITDGVAPTFTASTLDTATTNTFNYIAYDKASGFWYASTDNDIYYSDDDGVNFYHLYDFGVEAMLGTTAGTIVVYNGFISLIGTDKKLYPICRDYSSSGKKLKNISGNTFAFVADGSCQLFHY